MTECNRCGEDFENFFNGYNWCPNCGKVEIIRCKKCRVESIPYTCSECDFEGPN